MLPKSRIQQFKIEFKKKFDGLYEIGTYFAITVACCIPELEVIDETIYFSVLTKILYLWVQETSDLNYYCQGILEVWNNMIAT